MRVGGPEPDQQNGVARCTPVLLGHERSWRGVQPSKEHGHIIGQVGHLVPSGTQCRGAMVEVPERQGEQHHRADLVELELERGDHAEVAATPSHPPEQVWVVFRRGPDNGSLSRDDLHRNEVVAAQTGLSAQPADTSPEGEPSDTRVADETPRNS